MILHSGTQEFCLVGHSASLSGESEKEKEMKQELILYYKLAPWPLTLVQRIWNAELDHTRACPSPLSGSKEPQAAAGSQVCSFLPQFPGCCLGAQCQDATEVDPLHSGNNEGTREAKQVCPQCTAGSWLTLSWVLSLGLAAPREAEGAVKEREERKRESESCHT